MTFSYLFFFFFFTGLDFLTQLILITINEEEPAGRWIFPELPETTSSPLCAITSVRCQVPVPGDTGARCQVISKKKSNAKMAAGFQVINFCCSKPFIPVTAAILFATVEDFFLQPRKDFLIFKTLASETST